MFEEITKIISSINPKWSKDYIIRFLYVKLAPFFERDLEYFLKSPEEQYSEYKSGFIYRVPKVVCSTLADFYVDLYLSMGIKAKKIIANKNKIPLFALIVEGDHGWYYLDPLSDLFRNQYGLDTNYFGRIPAINKTIANDYPFLVTLPTSYLEEMDLNLHLYPYNMNLAQVYEVLRKEMLKTYKLAKRFNIDKRNKMAVTEQKLIFADQYLINEGHVPGPLERVMLYKYIARMLFDSVEKRYTDIGLDSNNNVIIVLSDLDKEPISYQEVRDTNNEYSLVRKKEN